MTPEQPERRALDRARRSVGPILAGFVCIVLAAAWLFDATSNVERVLQPSGSVIESAFLGVHHPPDVVQVGNHSFKSKSGAVFAQSRFAVNVAGTQVLEFYREELERNGWGKRRSFTSVWGSESSGHSYCKGTLMATIEILGSSTGASVHYAFGISWSSKSVRECS